MTRKIAILMGLIALLLTAPHGVAARKWHGQAQQRQSEQDAALEAMRNGEVMDYAKIRRRAEARLKGRLVGARLRRTGRGWVYEVRVRQKGGKVVFAILDARTGKRLGNEDGR